MATSYSAGERTGNSGVNFPSGGGLPLEEELPLSDPEEEDPQEDDDREWEYDPGDNDLPEYSQFDPFSIGNPDEPTGGDTNPNQTRRAPKKKRLKHYLNKRYREFRSSVIRESKQTTTDFSCLFKSFSENNKKPKYQNFRQKENMHMYFDTICSIFRF